MKRIIPVKQTLTLQTAEVNLEYANVLQPKYTRLAVSLRGASRNNHPSLRPTTQPEEVVHTPEQLHSHVVVNQGVLQHAGLETQVPDMLPHPSLATLLVVPGEQWQGQRKSFSQTTAGVNDADGTQ